MTCPLTGALAVLSAATLAGSEHVARRLIGNAMYVPVVGSIMAGALSRQQDMGVIRAWLESTASTSPTLQLGWPALAAPTAAMGANPSGDSKAGDDEGGSKRRRIDKAGHRRTIPASVWMNI